MRNEIKVKLFTHTDLDGYGCRIVLERLSSTVIPLHTEHLDYTNVNERIKEFIITNEYKNYGDILITDISVNEEVATMLESLYSKGVRILLLDHHPTALWLNKYKWCRVIIEENGEKTSGTEMVFNEYKPVFDTISTFSQSTKDGVDKLQDLVTQIKRYDTWLWSEKYKDNKPKILNDLFYILGSKRFIESVVENSYDVDLILDKYSLILELQQEKIQKYVEKKNKEIISMNVQGYNVGVVFAEQFISELGNELSKLNPQYDFIAMVSDKTISYRTVKDNINCGEVAKLLGGGGHPKAAGSQINEYDKMDYLNSIFKI